MIPLSVRMNGWMRYRDEQVADFRGGNLIAICGENGAGKSSIFDAMTFALYGRHRLGKQQATQLISQDMDRLSVEFEFEVEGQRYLVRRSRGQKQGERDQSLWVWDDVASEWAAVPGTEKEEGLERAIASVVRLSYEAFTASFLLQQNTATEFLDADPKHRFSILSSLIGLREYEAIERAALAAASGAKKYLDRINQDLDGTEAFDEGTVARLREEVAAASAREEEAAAALQGARAMLADAERHARLRQEIAALDAQIAEAAGLIAEKERIEQDALNFGRFSEAIDAVERIEKVLADAARAEGAAAAARAEAGRIDTAALSAAAEAADQAHERAVREARAAEEAHTSALRAEREAERFATAAAAIIAAREQLKACAVRIADAERALAEAREAQAAAETRATDAERACSEAEEALDAARRETAEAAARVKSLDEQHRERQAAAEESTCARCGQSIDRAAAKKQAEELRAQLAAARAALKSAQAAEKQASAALAGARKQRDEAAAALQRAGRQASVADAQLASATKERDQLQTQLAETEAALGAEPKRIAGAAAAHGAAREALAEAEKALTAARDAAARARDVADQARRAAEEGREARSRLEATAAERSAQAEGHRQTAAELARGLEGLAKAALEDPKETLATLRRHQQELAGAPGRKAALDRAIADHTGWTAQRAAKHDEVERIPEAHRLPEAQAAALAGEAEAAAAGAREALLAAQQELASMEARIEGIAKLREEKAALELRIKRLRRLRKLIGKNGLQGLLVSDALANITQHANAFLQKLTGGTLRLDLQRGEGDALEMRAIDSTCMRDPRSVQVLSGSQKFRCAVAIASGIGQYAGAGGMRSIVIDEGFGSLDEAGVQFMIAELKQLATHMDKVIVVSHLDAFRDRDNFPDQIVVETAGTSSRIRRLA